MNDFITDFDLKGKIFYNGKDIYSSKTDVVQLRAKIGMVFQKPNPFPKSIYKNITWGPKINNFKGDLDELVKTSLEEAALWSEVSDRLSENALSLSGGNNKDCV